MRWVDGRHDPRSVGGSDLLAGVLTGRIGLYAMDGSPEYRTLRRELEGAMLRLGAGRGLSMSVPGPQEGFLDGLQMLAHDLSWRTGSASERDAALPTALAS